MGLRVEMIRQRAGTCLLMLLSALLRAGTAQSAAAPAPVGQANTQAASPYVIRTTARLVYVDVSVTNKQGEPVAGLAKDSFHVSEGGAPQPVRYFEEHSRSRPAGPVAEMPRLPSGTFTNYQPVAPGGTLNILLLDTLNTPAADQSYVHEQLQEYIKHAPPGTRIAIFGLSRQLVLLQGFSSDPQTLKDAIHYKTTTHYSTLLDDPAGSGVDPATASNIAVSPAAPPPAINQAVTSAAANYQQFEAQIAATQVQFRLQYTLDAFNGLAHYLAAFPGRKNLIWFSGSFPLNILPSPGLQNPFAVGNVNEQEYRETVNLLTQAQVAVFPIDARGLRSPTVYSAASSGRRYSSNPQAFSGDVNQFTSDQTAKHATMDQMAVATGGRAFYNTNALSTAVAKAVDAGSSYYTLAYTPTNLKQDGSYRNIEVTLNPSAESRGLSLAFRKGYYAEEAAGKGGSTQAAGASGEARPAGSLARAAMSRGAPNPQDILFTVRVLPASNALEQQLAPGNGAGLAVTPKPPFRRYAVDCVTPPRYVTLSEEPGGRRTGKLEFLVYVFDAAGTLLNADGKTVELNLSPSSYRSFENGAIEAHLEVSVPQKVETFLRIGVRDVPTDRYGAVEIPVVSVSRLPVAVYPPGSNGAAGTGSKLPSPSAPLP